VLVWAAGDLGAGSLLAHVLGCAAMAVACWCTFRPLKSTAAQPDYFIAESACTPAPHCSYGLEEGALVLVSALGKPAASLLQHAADLGGGMGGGVVAQLQAQHEIAADLAAATAAAVAGGAAGDVKPEMLADQPADALQSEAAGGPEAAGEAGLEPQEKRQRVA